MGIVPADTPRDVLGLMMAGVPYDEAVAGEQEHAEVSDSHVEEN